MDKYPLLSLQRYQQDFFPPLALTCEPMRGSTIMWRRSSKWELTKMMKKKMEKGAVGLHTHKSHFGPLDQKGDSEIL